ncbi:hypothetical protein VTO42DRAFT_4034 [Malbranchea cinnamomea]
MTAALPSGLVSHTDHASFQLERIDSVDVEDLAKLWRVYTTNRTTFKEDTGRRLENLFWRIWSNPTICQVIRGSTVARLLIHISEGTPVVRTWPRARIRRRNDADQKSSQATDSSTGQNALISSSFHSPPALSQSSRLGSKTSLHRQLDETNAEKQVILPPPILKKSRAKSNEQHKNEQVLFLGVTETETPSRAGASPSPSHVLSGSYAARCSPSRKRTTFAENLVSPAEEQSSSRNQIALQATVHIETQPDFSLDVPGTETTGTQETLKSPKAPDLSPHGEKHISISSPPKTPRSPLSSTKGTPAKSRLDISDNAALDGESQPPRNAQTPLVDKDFRVKFVEKQQQQRESLSFNSPVDFSANNNKNNNKSSPDSVAFPQIFPPPLQRRTSSPYRSGGRSLFVSTAHRATPLSRSSSVQTISRRPVQSQLSKLIEQEREKRLRQKQDGEG